MPTRDKEKARQQQKRWRARNPNYFRNLPESKKEHHRKLTQHWIKRNKERYAQYKKVHRTKYFPEHLLEWTRRRAHKKGLFFDLSLTWVKRNLASGKCPMTGIAFDLDCTSTKWRRSPFRPSIDRIDPCGVYRKSNCRIVIWIFNHSKSDWTDSVVLTMAKGLVKNARKK